ncbi:MAG TPA: hypothetical protein VGQ41_21520 [Pyrinomonadaceae bacterium]|nr:hypothetical protein [Pyrinomonadaceae bacterium]
MNKDLSRAALRGGIGFCLVSLIVFATVAFGERWMYMRLGVLGAYVVWTLAFILLGGAVLGSLVADSRWRLPKFYLLWGVAFFAYAVGWVGAYFTLRGSVGEWVGSLVGSVLMAVAFALGFGAARSIPKLSALLFISNSAGYFLGSIIYEYLGRLGGMLLWGVVYGFFLGAGIGAALFLLQSHPRTLKSDDEPSHVL